MSQEVRYPIYKWVTTHLLTIYPNFQPDIQVVMVEGTSKRRWKPPPRWPLWGIPNAAHRRHRIRTAWEGSYTTRHWYCYRVILGVLGFLSSSVSKENASSQGPFAPLAAQQISSLWKSFSRSNHSKGNLEMRTTTTQTKSRLTFKAAQR